MFLQQEEFSRADDTECCWGQLLPACTLSALLYLSLSFVGLFLFCLFVFIQNQTDFKYFCVYVGYYDHIINKVFWVLKCKMIITTMEAVFRDFSLKTTIIKPVLNLHERLYKMLHKTLYICVDCALMTAVVLLLILLLFPNRHIAHYIICCLKQIYTTWWETLLNTQVQRATYPVELFSFVSFFNSDPTIQIMHRICITF